MANILFDIHGYPPYQNAGAEWMAKEIVDYLVRKGHYVRIILKQHNKILTSSKVNINWANMPTTIQPETIAHCYQVAHIVITHLDNSQAVTQKCIELGKHCINIIHHNWDIPHLRNCKSDLVSVVYNTSWIRKDRAYPLKNMVLNPPINPERFKDVKYTDNGNITLVNCNMDKGALIFQSIARASPDLKFLAVKGAHGTQLPLRGKNIVQWECQEDIREVFKDTRLLLVPSIYESYGRIGIEAMACGIPVICTDTPGLRESLENIGVYASREYLPSWLHNIRSVLNSPIDSGKYRDHANRVWGKTELQLETLNEFITQ